MGRQQPAAEVDDLDAPDALAVINAVDSNVTGFAPREIAGEAGRRSGLSDQAWMEAVAPSAAELLATGDYPNFARLVETPSFGQLVETPIKSHDHRRFDFGLDCLLRGIEARLST